MSAVIAMVVIAVMATFAAVAVSIPIASVVTLVAQLRGVCAAQRHRFVKGRVGAVEAQEDRDLEPSGARRESAAQPSALEARGHPNKQRWDPVAPARKLRKDSCPDSALVTGWYVVSCGSLC